MIIKHYLKKLIFLIIIISINTGFIYAKDLRITTSPNPAIQGEKIRFTLNTDLKVTRASLVFPDVKLAMNEIDKSLYTTNFWIPKDFKPGLHLAKLYIQTAANKVLLFFVKFDVISKSEMKLYAQNKDLAPNVVKSMANTDLNIKIDGLENKLDRLEKDKHNLKNKIAKLKDEIAKLENKKADEADLLEKMAELRKLENQLLSQKQTISSQMRTLKEELMKLSQKEEQLQTKEEHLTKREETVAKKEISLAVQAKDIRKLAVKVSKKENILAQKEKEIYKLNTHLLKKESTLSDRIAQINEKREFLSKQEKELSNFENEISKEKKEIEQEAAKIKLKENELTNKEADLTKQERKQIYLFSEEKKALNLKKENLTLKAQLQRKKLQEFKSLADDLHNEYQEFTETRKEMETLNKELDSKQDNLNSFKKWITGQTQDLHASLKKARQEEEDLIAYQQEYIKLAKLSKLLQERSKLLKDYSVDMKTQTEKLEQQIQNFETMLEPVYRYGFSPYIGLHNFHYKRGFSKGGAFGVNFIEYSNQKLAIELGLGLVSTTREDSGSQGKIITTYDINLLWDTLQLQDNANLYLSAGFGGDFEDGKYFGFSWGATIKLFHDETLSSRMHYRARQDSLVALGFEKKIRLFQAPSQKEMTLAQIVDIKALKMEESPDLHPKEVFTKEQLAPSVRLKEIKERPQYLLKDLNFADMKYHWAKDAVINLFSLGIISGKTPTTFVPKGNVTKIEATKMLTLAALVPNQVNVNQTEIEFSIIDIPQSKYLVSIFIQNENGRTIRTLFKEEEYLPGDYTVTWDGKDINDKRPKFGTYTALLTVASKDKDTLLIQRTAKFDISDITRTSVALNASPIPLRDIPENYWGKKYVNKSIEMNIFGFSTKGDHLNYYQPKRVVKKLDFIIAAGRTLDYLGAVNKNEVNLNSHRKLLKDNQKYVELYLAKIAKEADINTTISPKLLTRAEAAIILNRILNWKNENKSKDITIKFHPTLYTGKFYKVVVGIFLEYRLAEKLKNILEKFNIPSIISTTKTAKETVFNVEAGIFNAEEEALHQVNKLKEKGFEAFIQRP